MSAVRAFDLALVGPLTLGTVWMGRGALAGGLRERSLWGALSLVTAATVAGVPGVRRGIDGLLGVASGTNLIVHLLTLAAAACLIEFVHQTTGDRRRLSSPVRWLTVAGPALVLVFAMMPRPDGDEDLLTQATTGWSLAYWGIVTLYLGWGLTNCASMCLRYGGQAASGSLLTSLRLIGAGSVAGLLYVCHRVAYLAVQSVVPGWFRNSAVVATTQLLLACALLLLILGVAWPSLAERVRLRRVRGRLARIRPLWSALREAAPEVMLSLPSELKKDPDVLLYRYVIEIRDGALAVGSFDSGEVREAARAALAAEGLSGGTLDASVEAVSLRCALKRAAPGDGPKSPGRPPGAEPADDDLDAEVAWLEQVAVAYRTPLVRQLAEELAPASR
ncbi:MAB_1171c family putative transporter [Streptomyces xanthophaeus]|uniref:MAB_1171c family putative transporter n=1 Tax=Streptomyces xanthophaeus TaxID=67385 RepID=UPI00398FB356